jgi:malonyl-CoA decarboxylase
MNVSFFSDLLASISERGRGLIGLGRGDEHARASVADLVRLSHELISRRGEASGVALARVILDRYMSLPQKDRFAFLAHVAAEFGSDEPAIERAIEAYRQTPSRITVSALHHAAEPKSQELIRRLNLAQGGTLSLVRMREDLIDLAQMLRAERSDAAQAIDSLDADFVHLFSSWFNRGFLVLRRIDWSSPANVLEKIIRYEAVHRIRGWDDLRRRIDPPDRRCYAFFHPALVDEPLIFVEVALTREIPSAIAPILTVQRELVDPDKAATAVFYSISNCQRGLAGVSFGNFLIKQVVEEICRELPKLSTFVTLSPAPNFARWLARELKNEHSNIISEADRATLSLMERPHWWTDPEIFTKLQDPLQRLSAYYYLRAKTPAGLPVDAVARFHLGNGARLERINYLADTSDKAIEQACGLMVNYLYDLDDIEKNHEAFAEGRTVVASNNVQRLLRPPLELLPVAG